MKTMLLKLLLVAMAHIGIGFWFYRGRVLYSGIALLHSDLLVLGLPALMAFILYACVLFGWVRLMLPSTTPVMPSVAFALVATIISTTVLYYIAFNQYGT